MNFIKTTLAAFALAALPLAAFAGPSVACDKCCKDKGKTCESCCKDQGKKCADCCKAE